MFKWLIVLLAMASYSTAFADYLSGKASYDREEFQKAFEIWLPYAEKGDPGAQNGIAVLYFYGLGIPEDNIAAVKWFRRAAEQGLAKAQNNLGIAYDSGVGVPEDKVEAIKWYRLAAEQGNARGQYKLGTMYDFGQGVPEDNVEAIKWYRLATEQGNAKAQLNLGNMYRYGTGVLKNSNKAARLYRLSADQGVPDAQFFLGYMFDVGEGIDQNSAQAIKFYRSSAEQGHKNAQINLGLMYKDGKGVPENNKEALKWFRLAADQGMAAAQHNLGVMYDNGYGVVQDRSEAFKWYKLAAKQGELISQFNLGQMYERGEGVLRDQEKALKWYKLAADGGDAFAQYRLGSMYDYGEGIPRDDVEAVKWYRLAAEQGHAKAQVGMGIMYMHGSVPPCVGTRNFKPCEDNKKAFTYYKMAASQGYAPAQSIIGRIYYNGNGVKKDFSEAFKWHSLSAAQGNRASMLSLGIMFRDGIGTAQDYSKAAKWLLIAARQGDAEAEYALGDFKKIYFDEMDQRDLKIKRLSDPQGFEIIQYNRKNLASAAYTEAIIGSETNSERVALEIKKQTSSLSQHNRLMASQDDVFVDKVLIQLSIDRTDDWLDQEYSEHKELSNRVPIPLKKLQEILRENEALWTASYNSEGLKGYTFMVSKNDIRVKKIDVTEVELVEMVAAIRAGINLLDAKNISDLPEFNLDLAHELYSKLLAPTEDMLKEVKHLFVVPTGPLASLPFNMLVTQASFSEGSDFDRYKSAAWLPKKFSLTRLPSISTLRSLRVFASKPQATEAFKGFGDPILNSEIGVIRGLKLIDAQKGMQGNSDGFRSLPELPEASDELRLIAKYLNSSEDDLYLRGRATETVLKSLDLSKSRVLAFATHALLANEFDGISEPTLVLTPPSEATDFDDGLLTISEIEQLNLNADIVLLSACNTAAGKNLESEGLSGLARAFIYAGARSLLVSHWSVDSGSAAELTTGLFEALEANPEMGRAEALQSSMMSLASDSENPHYSHPAFCAPFSLIGEGAALN